MAEPGPVALTAKFIDHTTGVQPAWPRLGVDNAVAGQPPFLAVPRGQDGVVGQVEKSGTAPWPLRSSGTAHRPRQRRLHEVPSVRASG